MLNKNDYLTIPRVTDLLQVSRSTVYRLIRQGKLARVAVGGRTFITLASVTQILKPAEKPPSAPTIALHDSNGEVAKTFPMASLDEARAELVELVDSGDLFAWLEYQSVSTITVKETTGRRIPKQPRGSRQ